MALSELDIDNIIFYKKNPFDFLLDINSSPELTSLSTTLQDSITKYKNSEIDMTQLCSLIKDEFDKYITKNPSVIDRDFTSITKRFPIDYLVRPRQCRSTAMGFLDNYDMFYKIILFLVVLLYMKHKGIPETVFFKKTQLFGLRSISLLDHLRKKESEWSSKKSWCSDSFTKLIHVYEFVNSTPDLKPGLTLLEPKVGGRRTRYRKRKTKSKARKTRS
jgi:hypothetical protein